MNSWKLSEPSLYEKPSTSPGPWHSSVQINTSEKISNRLQPIYTSSWWHYSSLFSLCFTKFSNFLPSPGEKRQKKETIIMSSNKILIKIFVTWSLRMWNLEICYAISRRWMVLVELGGRESSTPYFVFVYFHWCGFIGGKCENIF